MFERATWWHIDTSELRVKHHQFQRKCTIWQSVWLMRHNLIIHSFALFRLIDTSGDIAMNQITKDCLLVFSCGYFGFLDRISFFEIFEISETAANLIYVNFFGTKSFCGEEFFFFPRSCFCVFFQFWWKNTVSSSSSSSSPKFWICQWRNWPTYCLENLTNISENNHKLINFRHRILLSLSFC